MIPCIMRNAKNKPRHAAKTKQKPLNKSRRSGTKIIKHIQESNILETKYQIKHKQNFKGRMPDSSFWFII